MFTQIMGLEIGVFRNQPLKRDGHVWQEGNVYALAVIWAIPADAAAEQPMLSRPLVGVAVEPLRSSH